MGNIKTKYGEREIEFLETDNVWLCQELDIRSTNLSELKKKIDKHGEAEKKFVRVAAFVKNYNEGYLQVTVTSIAEPNRYSSNVQYWTVRDDGKKKKREKRGLYELFADTSDNRTRIEKIKELKAQIKKLDDEMDAIDDKMEHLELTDEKD